MLGTLFERQAKHWAEAIRVAGRHSIQSFKDLPNLRTTASCLASFFVHLVVILLATVFGIWPKSNEPVHVLILSPPSNDAAISVLTHNITASDPSPQLRAPDAMETLLANAVIPEAIDIPSPEIDDREPSSPNSTAAPAQAAEATRAEESRLSADRGGFHGRKGETRKQLVATRGGTPASEDAVARGLAWLAAHQRPDGSWRFQHHGDGCPGLCRHPGTVGSTTGATGLALLPFLGAGEIGEASPYNDVVQRGLYYLTHRMIVTRHGGDLQEGTMYAHGIATIALCEAFAMTEDQSLRPVAQQAVNFICNVQHEGGGWRYFPGQPGDMTVFGWQFMALKSAHMAGLDVSPSVIDKACRFLDSMQTADGAFYGYLKAGKERTPTAVGLLSRMYTGWDRENPRLADGIDYLAGIGPSRTDMYFNYYATQVMHHFEGDGWPAWNTTMRDRLVATQSRRGHENGSWHFNDEHADSGGRLYSTAMCLMILEVYYRHMPLYGRRTVEGDR